jgi:tetratricopeptide (TPR) repeat protein
MESCARWDKARCKGVRSGKHRSGSFSGRKVTIVDQLILKRLEEMSAQEGPEPAAALRRLAVCQGGFTSEAAAAILEVEDTAALESLLATLRGWQFVTLQAANHQRQSRYLIDPLVVAEVGIDENAYPAFYDYYEGLARHQRETDDYSGLEAELPNLQAAFDWSLEQDVAAAYWLYTACSEFLLENGHPEEHIDWIRRVAVAVRGHPDQYLQGAVHNTLGVAHQNSPAGDRRDNLFMAVAAYQDALRCHTPAVAPLSCAVAQHNLGTAYADLARIEDRMGNLGRAIAAYQEALRYRTPEQAPPAYAATQNVLGLAYRALAGVDDRLANLRRAIEAHQNALRHYTPQTLPYDYAVTQNNLGNAYRDLASVEDARGNLQRAIEAYQAALLFHTPYTAPLAYAATKNNLGTAYRAQADIQEQATNLRRAVAAFEDALRYYTPQRSPSDYAAVRNNLGSAYRALAVTLEETFYLERAVEAFEDALRYYTPQHDPLNYAKTQANLGLAREDLGARDQAIACWREAVQYFQQMGEFDIAESVSAWIRRAEAGPGQAGTGLSWRLATV